MQNVGSLSCVRPDASQALDFSSTSSSFDSPTDDTTYIFADIVIPGRGQPIPNAIIAVSPSSGKITHVGSQANFPNPPPKSKQVHVHCLLPGLWDVHAHFTGITQIDFPEMITTHPATCGAAIARSFHDTLMAGITSVRDVGSFAVEAHVAVEKGYILGPTVYGSGAAIGITGGSCDAVMFPADFMYARFGVDHSNYWAGCGMMVVADGVDECRRAVRQQIRRGAKCIKIVASGGVLSRTDDPQYRQYSDEELRVLVEESSLQGRAVAIHAHGKKGIMAAIKAGAHTIEHGSYIDEEAATLMKERGVTLVATRHVVEAGLKRLDKMHPATARKMVMVAESHEKAYQTAIRLGVKIAMGTDIAGAEPGTEMSPGKQASELVYAVQAGLTPLQAIEAGTINSAETLGPQAPKKGLIAAGWDADMIALDKNVLEDITIISNPQNIRYVWKEGKVVKAPGHCSTLGV